MAITIYIDAEVLAVVSVVKPDGSVGSQLLVREKDIEAWKACGVVAWIDDAKSELPSSWTKDGKPLHEYLGLSPRPVAKISAMVEEIEGPVKP